MMDRHPHGSLHGHHDFHVPPVSRTTQYKKVTKPLLERKRRARINRCLDELKDLMVGALEAEGENVSKLEKADILELTVRHLHSLGRPRDPVQDAHRFQAGFSQCASEACQFLLSLPGLDAHVGRRLVSHLGQCAAGPLSVQVAPPARSCYSPPVSPAPYTPHTPRTAASPSPSPSSCSSSASASASASTSASYSEVHRIASTPSVYELSRPLTGLLMTVQDTPGPSCRQDVVARRDIGVREGRLCAASGPRVAHRVSRPPQLGQADEDEGPEDLSMWRPW